jgi:predicted SPOUT superfamily RNA methylase MTH1
MHSVFLTFLRRIAAIIIIKHIFLYETNKNSRNQFDLISKVVDENNQIAFLYILLFFFAAPVTPVSAINNNNDDDRRQ